MVSKIPILRAYAKLIRKGIQKVQSKRETQKQLLKFQFGNQDIIDLVSYSGMKESPDHLYIDNTYFRTIFISGFPYVASSGWLNNLINSNHNIDISYHIEQVDALVALPKLNRKITEMESTKRSMQRSGKIIGSELLDPLESAIALKDKIQRGQEKLFQVSIYVTMMAESLAELNKLTTVIESTLATRLFYSKTATFQQLDALQSVLPRAENLLQQRRNLDSSSAALTFPFISSELVYESGILYGVNKSNNSLVIVDRFSLNNANSIIFAQSGSGKSYTAKVEILRQLMMGTHVIVLDPEGEYAALAKSVGGTVISLSTDSKEKINPFDLGLNSHTKEQLSTHIQDLTEIISLLSEGLTAEEKAVVDTALLETYAKCGITLDSEQVEITKNTYPTLTDFYKVLKKLKRTNICNRLEKYVKGSLSSVFTHQTNIDINNRLVVFNLKDMNESLRQIMLVVISHYVYGKVKGDIKKRLLVIDEGWSLLQHEESARFISGLTRRARKYFLGVSFITQQAQDFLNNEYGKAIASQSSMRILLKQDTTTIRSIVEEFNLSEYEENFLLTCDKGEGILIADQNHVAVKVVASDSEHPIITTNPAERYVQV